MRPAVPLLVVGAMAFDAVLGAARTGAPSVPVVTLSVVAAVALGVGRSAGAIAGFGAGVVLDLLAGPASPGGVHALVGLAVGTFAGAVRPRVLGPVGRGIAVGAPAVGTGTAVTLVLQGLATSAPALPAEMVGLGTLAGAVACPMVVRLLRGALSERVPAA